MSATGITIDTDNGEPLYRQIAAQIAARIASGAFPAGYRLPATRTLAGEVGANRNTVVRAYAELEADGLVSSAVGRGTFVCARAAAAAPDTPRPRAMQWGSVVSRAARAEPLGRFDRLSRGWVNGDAINLTRMQPAEELLPHRELAACLERVLVKLGGKALGYAPREGEPRLREVIAERLSTRGLPVDKDELVITTGSQQGLDLLTRALIDPGDAVLAEAATYAGALNVFAAAGARPIGIPSDEEGPRLDALERQNAAGAKALYLMPDCHNPTGATISEARRNALLEWSRAAAVPLIEDDFAAELDIAGDPPPVALRALDGDVIYIGTFSKKLIPALRVGFVVCPPALRPRLVPLKHTMDLGTSSLLQVALADFLERGLLERHLKTALPAYRARRDTLGRALAEFMPTSFSWKEPVRGVSFWIPLPRGLDPERVFDEARRAGVLVSPSTLNSVDGGGQAGIRLNFCTEDPDRLREGARRLGESLEKMIARRRDEPSRSSLGVV